MPPLKRRGRTLLDLMWPDESQDYMMLAQKWSIDAVKIMMTASWEGYNDLVVSHLGEIDTSQAEDELERAITQLLEPCIRRRLSGDEPYYIQHGSYEFATRKPAPAQPPQYDIAFVLHENRKIMWPMEAKVLRSDGYVSRYIRDVREEFLTGRYAPFVNGGAMLGYLLEGLAINALENIEQQLGRSLNSFGEFDQNRHRVSIHTRLLERIEFASGSFCCHHLIMDMSCTVSGGQDA